MGRHSADHRAGVDGDSGTPSGIRLLEGARILLTRSSGGTAELTGALQELGAEPLLMPLIDFERASDQHSLDVAFDALGAGAYQWLVISSATTVRALEEKAAERGTKLSRWLPATLRVAAVGSMSRAELHAHGVEVDLMPEGGQSAAGLVEIWPSGQGLVVLPQADIADPKLAKGLQERGATVQTVTAYQTVDYPADPARSLGASAPAEAEFPALTPLSIVTPAMVKAELEAGRLHAVVAASPSAVRRLHSVLAPLGECRLVAIGPSTAAQAAALGLTVAAIANQPTAEGLLEAVVLALAPDSPHVLQTKTDSATSDHQ